MIWPSNGGGFPGFILPLVFRGIGLVAHGLGAFMGTGYADRLALKEYKRLKAQR
ncbi:MAG: 2TM domain-containing protein [Methanomassiliicoccus sp.]|nr:2TM domain-containing protein [Methanomassiliicoccus sp.]